MPNLSRRMFFKLISIFSCKITLKKILPAKLTLKNHYNCPNLFNFAFFTLSWLKKAT